MHDVMTIEEVAEYLRVHYDTVRRWCRKGTLPAAKVGGTYRIRRDTLEALWHDRGKQDEPQQAQAQQSVHGNGR
jgi:excisionase family DNA binding protein